MKHARTPTVILTAAAIVLLTGACGKKPRVPPPVAASPPAPEAPLPSLLEEADRSFADARYAEAARIYQRYLGTEAAGTERDRALFRLGMSYALSENSPQATRQAQGHLEALLMQYSRSPYAAEARFILDLLQELRSLRTGLRTKDSRIAALQSELEKARKSSPSEARQERDLQQDIERLQAEAREKDERIKQLAEELDRLKKIDMQRRTPRVP